MGTAHRGRHRAISGALASAGTISACKVEILQVSNCIVTYLENKLHTRHIKIGMHGVTGRMGGTQHLERSICALRAQGGVELADGGRLMPEPVLIGRSETKLEALAARFGLLHWSTDLEDVIQDPEVEIIFDAGATNMRSGIMERAIAARKHVYCEKPISSSSRDVAKLAELADAAEVKTGVVQDKLWLPGILKLKRLIDQGFFGDILCVKIDFGYWVFAGETVAAQRPSWNYRNSDGGGIILDMMPHWHYVIENLFGAPTSIFCKGQNHLVERRDEKGSAYVADADDACYAIVELNNRIIVQINSSWCTRVDRDDLVTIQVDGTSGSAVAGLSDVKIQPLSATPRPIWNPDNPNKHMFADDWLAVPTIEAPKNAFLAQWELFLRHVAEDAPYRWNFRSGAKDVAFAEASLASWKSGTMTTIQGVSGE